MEQVPAYVSVAFLITSFVAVGIFLYAVRGSAANSFAAKFLLFAVPFWMLFEAVLAVGGYFQNTDAFPPRIFLFGFGPTLALIAIYFLFARQNFIADLPLKILTIIHVVRIPVEMILSSLYEAGMVPGQMTFHGTNFDILSGITAPIVYFLAFRGNSVNKPLLVIWNIAALCLVLNVVTTAILSIPTPIQQLSFDQPNRAVLFFPYIWLATVIVPIVLFAHLASLYQLLARSPR